MLRISDVFPHARHVAEVGLERADDAMVLAYAGAHGCAVVTKDSDFADLVLRTSTKIVWLRLGNCTTDQIESALRDHATAIAALTDDPGAQVLVIS